MDQPFNTETIEHCGVVVKIGYFYDHDMGRPWGERDGNVNIYELRGDKKPSEIILKTNGSTTWAYDIQEAIALAKRESWGIDPRGTQNLTKKQRLLLAVEHNVEMWRGLLNDDWFYAGVVCTVLDSEGGETDISDSCWGFETLNDYHETAGREMAESLAESTHKARSHQWRAALKEARARKYWACRDVETVGA